MSEQKPKHIYIEESALDHYSADAFLVRCVDNRFWKVAKHFIKDLGFKHIDPKTPAGGAKVFSSPFHESDREHYLRELAVSVRLQHVTRVMLFSHHDCGAYGGFANFNNDRDVEIEHHRAEHLKGAETIKEHFPELAVETYFIDDKGIIKTS